jgi:putative methyltransferase (TIGR04325 family)
VEPRTDQIYFSGEYSEWAEASHQCTACDTGHILERVLSATLKVRRGEAIEQKDGVFFGRVPYNFALISALLSAAIHGGNRLSVLDFGGSLGISYFHIRDFLRDVSEVAWSVIELPDFVTAGRKHLESEELTFYETVEDCMRYHTPNIIVISGVLQCLADPWKTLKNLLQIGTAYVFIDRTGMIESDRDRLTIQHVPEWIYRVDKPVWFLSESKLRSCLADADYVCLCDFAAIDDYTLPGAKVSFKGFIYRKNRNGT